MSRLSERQIEEIANGPKAKLSSRQTRCLEILADGKPHCAYPSMYLGTLNSLSLKGYVRSERGPGSMMMPRTSIKWLITPSGRAALAQA